MWTSKVRNISSSTRTLVTLSRRQNSPITCSLNRCLTAGSQVCHRDGNQQHRSAASYSTTHKKQEQDWSSLLTALAGLGVSLSAFLLWMKKQTVYAKEVGIEEETVGLDKKPKRKVLMNKLKSKLRSVKGDVTVVEPVIPKFPDHCKYLLIGAGLASLSAFKAIKTQDPKAKVLMIGDEHYIPYNRPPLSKQLWYEPDPENVKEFSFIGYKGRKNSVFLSEGLYMEPSQVADNENGGLAHMKDTKVVWLDPKEKKVVLNDGHAITFDKCLIATGGKPKNLEIFQNADADVKKRVTVFRGLDDLVDLYEMTDSAKSVAVIGGSFLGSELATAMAFKGKKTGMKVYQVFPQEAHLPKILIPYIGSWVTERVKEEGVIVHPQTDIVSVSSDGDKVRIELSTNMCISVDHVVVAVGLEPNTELAKSSGLPVDSVNGGFVTDSQMKICDDIYAAGDVASYDDPDLGRRRVEHYDHASVTGKLAGKNMTGESNSYSFQSMFWADLGRSVAINAVGVVDAKVDHRIFFGSVKDGIGKADWKCTAVVLYQRNGKVVGVLTFNLDDPGHMSLAREVIKDGCEGQDLTDVADQFLKPKEEE